VRQHYRGRLDDVGQIDAITAELIDIAESMKWPYKRLDDDWDRPADATISGAEITGHLALKGVALKVHPQCEPVSFFFDPHGSVRDVMGMLSILNGTRKPEDVFVSVKTQFATAGVHITIVKLLRYLKKRYMFDLEVADEGGYWETGDEAGLKEKMAFLDGKIAEVADALSSAGVGDTSGLSPDEMADVIGDILRRKLGGEEASP